MAKLLLTARRVTALLNGGKPRWHGDGGNLYLQVNGTDRGAWVFSQSCSRAMTNSRC